MSLTNVKMLPGAPVVTTDGKLLGIASPFTTHRPTDTMVDMINKAFVDTTIEEWHLQPMPTPVPTATPTPPVQT